MNRIADWTTYFWRRHWLIYVQLSALLVLLSSIVGYHYLSLGLHLYPRHQRGYVHAAQPEEAPRKLQSYGCVGCHVIPGVPRASGTVGPRLAGLHKRIYIAGVLPQSPQNLVRWIQHPKDVDPRTAMPDLGVSEQDARDMAAYLYSLD